jgi:hypothetical protein
LGIWLIPKILKILHIWDFGHLVSERYPHKSQVIHFLSFYDIYIFDFSSSSLLCKIKVVAVLFSLFHLLFFFLRIGGGFSVEVGSLWRFSDWIFGDAVSSMLVGL